MLAYTIIIKREDGIAKVPHVLMQCPISSLWKQRIFSCASIFIIPHVPFSSSSFHYFITSLLHYFISTLFHFNLRLGGIAQIINRKWCEIRLMQIGNVTTAIALFSSFYKAKVKVHRHGSHDSGEHYLWSRYCLVRPGSYA